MRILWLTPSLPCPTTGNRVRQFGLIKQLSIKHQVTVLSFVCDFESSYVALLRELCADLVVLPLPVSPPLGLWRNRLRSWRGLLFDPCPGYIRTYPMSGLLQELDRVLAGRTFDLINIETLHPAQLVDCRLAPRTVITEHNIEFAIQRGRVALERRPLARFREWIEWHKLRRYERTQLRRFSGIVTVSEPDAALARQLAPRTPVYVVPNGVDVCSFAPPLDHDPMRRKGLIFSGTMDYGPNIDGVIYFCREIWPRVRQAQPDVILTIAGARPGPEVLALGNQPGIIVTGFVEDMRPYLWQTAVSVVPLRNGGGTRLKILEAMAAGLPVVSTTIGAEGLEVSHEENIMLADTPTAFAGAVMRLLEDADLADQLRRNGRRLVEERYDWRMIAERLDAAFRQALTGRD